MAKPVYINRISACLPHDPVDNEQMEARLGQVGDRPSRARSIVLRRNGIRQRHYVIDPATGEPSMTNAQLSAEAVRGLASPAELAELQCLVAATSSPDQTLPGHAVMVHGELGNPPCEVVTTAGICLCGVSALKYAWLNVASGESRNAVACGSEVASALMQARNFSAEIDSAAEELERRPELAFEKDFLRWMLSDGAGAVWLEDRPNPEGLSRREMRAEDIDWFLPHYSSEFFRDRLAEGLARIDFAIPQQRWFTNLTRKGNTGAASFFIMLDELFHSGQLRAGQRLLGYVPESGRFSSAFLHMTVVRPDEA